MKTVSNRQLRRTVVAQQRVLDDGVAPALTAALKNEELTRARVTSLEAWRDAWVALPFRRRLRWLVRGY